MKDNTTILPFRQSDKIDDPLTEIAREGARRMLAEALVAEADAFVAGFSEEDINIETKEQSLTITGEKVEEISSEFLHQGIAARNFERQFRLADHVEVTGASLTNGLLHVDLKRELPETMKPRSIEITAGQSTKPKVIGKKAA